MIFFFSSVWHFFLFENIQNCQFFLEKLIYQWIPDRDGRGIARDINKKINSIFKTWQKMVTKFGQFKKLKCPNFVNCPNFVTISCRVMKMKIIFFDIPSYPPPIAVQHSLTNQFFKTIDDSVYFQQLKKNKTEEKRRVISAF